MAIKAKYEAPLQVVETREMRDRVTAIAELEEISQAQVIRDILAHGIDVTERQRSEARDRFLLAIEDRCSHDDGNLADGEFDPQRCTVECPRHGSLFDLRTGKPMTLPAYVPIDTFEVRVEDDMIKLEVE